MELAQHIISGSGWPVRNTQGIEDRRSRQHKITEKYTFVELKRQEELTRRVQAKRREGC